MQRHQAGDIKFGLNLSRVVVAISTADKSEYVPWSVLVSVGEVVSSTQWWWKEISAAASQEIQCDVGSIADVANVLHGVPDPFFSSKCDKPHHPAIRQRITTPIFRYRHTITAHQMPPSQAAPNTCVHSTLIHLLN